MLVAIWKDENKEQRAGRLAKPGNPDFSKGNNVVTLASYGLTKMESSRAQQNTEIVNSQFRIKRNQIGRRNISIYLRGEYCIEVKDWENKRDKARQIKQANLKHGDTLPILSFDKIGNTTQDLADKLDVGLVTASRIIQIQQKVPEKFSDFGNLAEITKTQANHQVDDGMSQKCNLNKSSVSRILEELQKRIIAEMQIPENTKTCFASKTNKVCNDITTYKKRTERVGTLDMPTQQKNCKICGVNHPLHFFRIHRMYHDSIVHHKICKACESRKRIAEKSGVSDETVRVATLSTSKYLEVEPIRKSTSEFSVVQPTSNIVLPVQTLGARLISSATRSSTCAVAHPGNPDLSKGNNVVTLASYGLTKLEELQKRIIAEMQIPENTKTCFTSKTLSSCKGYRDSWNNGDISAESKSGSGKIARA